MKQRRLLYALFFAAATGVLTSAPLLWGASAARQPPVEPAPAVPDATPEAQPALDDEPDEPETELLLTDGRRVTGVLLERTDREVVLRIGAVPTPFPADAVAQVKTGPTVLERYREMRKAIDDRDVAQRLRLAQWLRARRRYRLALDEVTGLLVIEPANPDARQLHVWLSEQLKLVPRQPPVRAAPPQPAVAPDKQPAPPPQPAPAKPAFPLLTGDQINLIRIYEVDLNDPPRMLVDRETITALLTQHVGEPAIPDTREGRDALYRKRPGQILELMFQLKARDLYGRVQVQEDPASMRYFRDHVHATWLMNSCATNQCHGGQDAGRLRLYNKKPSADATVYTNFLILERFLLTPRPGAANPDPAAPPRRLIDYDDPAKSPLLQVGLPRADSIYPHPQVNIGGRQRGFSPVFQSIDDRRFQDAVRWIRSMYRPRPEYPVQYDPPMPAAPTRPEDANKPAGER